MKDHKCDVNAVFMKTSLSSRQSLPMLIAMIMMIMMVMKSRVKMMMMMPKAMVAMAVMMKGTREPAAAAWQDETDDYCTITAAVNVSRVGGMWRRWWRRW